MGGFVRTGSGRVGDIRISSGPELDRDLLLCDGAVYDVSQFPRLYGRIGAKYNRPGDSFAGLRFRVPQIDFARQAQRISSYNIDTDGAGNIPTTPVWGDNLGAWQHYPDSNADWPDRFYVAVRPRTLPSPPGSDVALRVYINSRDNSGNWTDGETIFQVQSSLNAWHSIEATTGLSFPFASIYDPITSASMVMPSALVPLIVAVDAISGDVSVVLFSGDASTARLVHVDTNDTTNKKFIAGIFTTGASLPVEILPETSVPASALPLLSGYINALATSSLGVGALGGNASVTLTTNNIPQHSHQFRSGQVDSTFGYTNGTNDRRPRDWTDTESYGAAEYSTGPAGLLVPDPVPIMPPYQSVIYGIKYR